MSTDSGSSAADDPRGRNTGDVPPGEDAGSGTSTPPPGPQNASGATGSPRGSQGEPDVTRRLETQPRAERPGSAGMTGAGGTASTNDTAVINTRDANTQITGTRNPNDAAYRTDDAPDGTGRRAAHRDGAGTAGAASAAGAAGAARHGGSAGAARLSPEEPAMPNREALLAAERERFGGIKFGAAFFGWLTATGMVVLLSALAAAIGAAVGVSTDTDLGAALDQAAANQSTGLIGAIITLAVLLLAYYAGGYVAGRMARFNGAKQGVAVWLWALVAAAVVIVLGLIFNDDIRSLTQLNSVAPLPQDLGNVSAGSWLALLATVVVSLIGAVLGGLAGMRFHRRVDRATFTPAPA